jgi:hypothetical protein
MRKRCRPDANERKYYADKGVIVCDRWLGPDGFVNFVADLGERPPGTTLDRFPDKNGHYAPDNCRWATPTEQSGNRRNVTMTISRIAETCGRYEHGEIVTSIMRRMKITKTTVYRWLRQGGITWQQSAAI